ncbi:sugar ABC transporter ATP-binding protein [Nakamurella silvestris]|nr:sugar ABC transporter ATP-binding protein [Nakamurella silvestris]
MTSTTASAPEALGGKPSATPLIEMRGIFKSFLGNEVLHGVDLVVRAGEVHALVGENGAGKSTMMKILAGVYRPDGGQILLDGEPVSFEHPLAAQAAGVTTVFQEFNLLADRTVAQNVFLGREPSNKGIVDSAKMNSDTTALLKELGMESISARTRVGSLSVAEQQIVEIVKALSQDARIISMDEPTAALSDVEVRLLYQIVRQLQARGVAVLYVSHRLKEIFDLCSRITVMKDGSLVRSFDTDTTSPDELVRTMVGREFSGYFPPIDPQTQLGPVRLQIRGGGNSQVNKIDLSVRGGEIVALAGLQGSGRTEIAHGLFGIEPFTRGEVFIDGKTSTVKSPRSAVRAGLALVTEDRKTEGLALRQSVFANARLVLDAVRPFGSAKDVKRIPGLLSSLELSARGLGQEVRYLSGGNQQKVVLAKWLVTDPKVIILDEPTRGIDVGAKRAVYDAMRVLTKAGIAILMISSELPEVIGMADRIVVLHEGEIAGELAAGSDEESIMTLATGHAPVGQLANGVQR